MRSYEGGVHEVADRVFAYLQPDGSWGWSNAGLVVGEHGSLLVDTLFDLKLTRTMLDQLMPIAGRITPSSTPTPTAITVGAISSSATRASWRRRSAPTRSARRLPRPWPPS